MRGVGDPRPPGAHGNGVGVVGSIAEFGSDVATLVELQAQLASADLKESSGRAVVPVVLVAAALALGLGGVPVALLGAADLLATALGVSPGLAKLITAAIALAVAGLVAFVGSRSLIRSLDPLRRSHEELIRNLSWLKTVLVYSGRSYPRHR